MTVLTLVIPFTGLAAAHPSGTPSTSLHDLEITPEVDTNPTGTTHTLTAFVTDTAGANAGAGHLVDFEVESGPAVVVDCAPAGGTAPCTGGTNNNDGNTPLSPDLTCTTNADGICQVFFTSQTVGTNIIRGWVDDDTSNATGPAEGDGDPTETRYAGSNDCLPDPYLQPGQTQAGQDAQYGAGAGDQNPDGSTCAAGTPANTVAEPDDTDVVSKTWQGAFAQGCVDAEPETAFNARGTTHTITAKATSGQLTLRGTPGTPTDNPGTYDCNGAALSGATITFDVAPDDSPNVYVKAVNGVATGGPFGGDGPDSVTCTTGADGTCTFTIELVNQNDPLTAGATPDTNNTLEVTLNNSGGTQTQVTDTVRKTWFIPGEVSVVDGTPEIDTNEIGQTHTITCLTADGGGNPVATQTCAARVIGGTTGNVARDLDGNPATTPGYIGSCETGATGTCTITYTSTVAGDDTIQVFNDPNRSQVQNGTEAFDDITKNWVATNTGPSRVGADVEVPGSAGPNGGVNTQFCQNEPVTADNGAHNTQGETNETAELFCARAFAPNGTTVTPTQITFTITSGPGQFTNRAGTANSGSSVVTEADACNTGQTPPSVGGNFNCTFLKSPSGGTTTVTACITGTTSCVTLTKLWRSFDARTITCDPPTATNEPGTQHNITCTVKDAATPTANPVEGFYVEAKETGPGFFTGSTAETGNNNCNVGWGACGITDAQGQVVFTTTTSAGEEGEQTITATLDSFHENNNIVDECERAAGDPTGAPAGVCEDTVTKTWAAAPPPPPPPPVLEKGRCAGFAKDSRTARPSGGFVIVGTSGSDVLDGSGGPDLICALGGDDVVSGRGSNDQILAGGGNDNVGGGRGKDSITGGGGNDILSGNRGNDAVKGNAGNDTLKGNGGIDSLTAGDGADSLQGGNKPDILKGNAGDDNLRGGKGNDQLDGGPDTDTCSGGPGTDTFVNCE